MGKGMGKGKGKGRGKGRGKHRRLTLVDWLVSDENLPVSFMNIIVDIRMSLFS